MNKLTRSPKILLILLLSLALLGCGKKANDTAEILERAKIQESQINHEYPEIVFIENASYYGTDEKCDKVPRNAPDGVIETFVDAPIMPDVDGYANFGADQGKLEYMFGEDGRLIVHIGEDWYYFEKQEENVTIGNPSKESDEKGVLQATDDENKDDMVELKEYFLGEHIRSDDQSSISINENSDGTYDLDISIIRLCSLENGVGKFEDHMIKFTVKDPNDNALQGKIYRDADNSFVLEITDSTWEYLPNGEKLTGFE